MDGQGPDAELAKLMDAVERRTPEIAATIVETFRGAIDVYRSSELIPPDELRSLAEQNIRR
jgi:hypothetical protein